MSAFVRPQSLSFPQVYHTFQAKNKAGDATIEYQIRDLPEELYNEALELLASDFVTEETLCVAKNISANAEATGEVCYFWFKILAEKFSVGCFANDGSNELAGVAIMAVHSKSDKEDNLKPNENDTIELLGLLRHLMKQYDVFGQYGVDKYLSDYAIVTKKAFRGRGVATEFIKSRTPMMKALNLTVTSSMYTVIGSQKAATKAGHKEMKAIPYKGLEKSYPTFDFSKANVDAARFMDFKL